VLLVFVAAGILEAGVLSVLLGLSAAGIGVSIQHDGGHRAYSSNERLNSIAAACLDLIGGSSYVWKWKHTRYHHTYVNLTNYDTDLDLGGIGRITPRQKRRWFHRLQHLYLWPMYSLLAIKWQFFDDFAVIATGRLGIHKVPRPAGKDLVLFIAGKVGFFLVAFGIPVLFHPWHIVLLFYLIAAMVAGICLSLIFILPHTVEESVFPVPSGPDEKIFTSRAEHQARVTADFSRGDKFFTWLVGGLNFHREHHLFPSVCHLYTPALAPIIDSVCEEYGVTHVVHPSYAAGIASHFRLLRRMGREN
jgi:linoleoyl-CoA desaturase